MPEPYKRPPITEAIIGITFAEQLDPAKLGKANKRFVRAYPQHVDVRNVSLKVELSQEGRANTDEVQVAIGHRRSNADADELLVLWPSEFVVSQLAPYPGWEAFIARFRGDWKIWKQVTGFRQVSRVGVRFINRIDIPVIDNRVEHEKYLNVYTKLPDLISEVGAYGVQMAAAIEEIKCVLRLNSGTVSAPILSHGSFLLDMDFGRTIDVPQSDADILVLLNQIRMKKNEVFEACITNRARKLFRK